VSTEPLPPDLDQAVLARVRALAASPEALAHLTAEAPVALFLVSADGGVGFVNARFCALTGLEPEQALGHGWLAAVHPDDRERAATLLSSTEAAGSRAAEVRFQFPDGSIRVVEAHLLALPADGDGHRGWAGACLDVTARETAYQAALGAGERFRLALDQAPVASALTTPEGDMLYVNAAFCRLVGYPESDLLVLNAGDLIVPGEGSLDLDRLPARGECRYRRADGTTVWVAAQAALVRGSGERPDYLVLQVEDIGDRKQTERELRLLADHDALTGLLNRRGFMDGLHRELRRMDRRGEYGALLVLDLDNFKLVNDTAGHLAGDEVLRTTAEVLRRRLRATDVIGRLGGDEFAALVLNVTPDQANEIAAETGEALRGLTVSAGDQTIQVAASIGVVAVDEMAGAGENELLAAADRAMYEAKSERRQG
jgi:diguanylate cyclase (GGDEF)-like protein/PAS domain S-box-containing protein